MPDDTKQVLMCEEVGEDGQATNMFCVRGREGGRCEKKALTSKQSRGINNY